MTEHKFRWWIALVPALSLGTLSSTGVHAQVASLARPFSPSTGATTPEQRQTNGPKLITVRLKNVLIDTALQQISRLAGAPIHYSADIIDTRHRVTLQVSQKPVDTVLRMIFTDPSIRFITSASGDIVVTRATDTRTAQNTTGTIRGRVTDSATKLPIAAATVTVVGTKLSATTSATGEFTLSGVPSGEQRIMVRQFGYRSVTPTVQVVEGKQSTMSVILASVPTSLSGVVTTATGIQQKIEVGNDITRVNVDSVLREMPVTTFTELLATRVPGLDAAPTSGAPGAPTRVRIRGISSINATNDPIIILDGIRMYSAQGAQGKDVRGLAVGDRSTQMARPQLYAPSLVRSPLDQIDPNSIETVEVLKGPSAVALYGTDAANGIIVITTKRGQAGPPQWGVSASMGTESMPGKWPLNYYRWGRFPNNPNNIQCTLAYQAAALNACTPDSLVTYQILNDDETTLFGKGRREQYRADVRGGTRGLTYAFSASMGSVIGLTKIPDADVALLKEIGEAVPDWQRHPQGSETQGGSARIEAEITPKLRVSFSSLLNRDLVRTTSFDRALTLAPTIPPIEISIPNVYPVVYRKGSGLLQMLPDFRARTTSQTLRSTTAVQVSAQPGWNVTTSLTTGADVSSRKDLSWLDRNQCFAKFGGSGCSGGANAIGYYNTGQGTTTVTSLSLLASAPIPIGRMFSVRTSIGGNYAGTKSEDLMRTASDLPAGATSGNGAVTIGGSERVNESITAGTYLETVVNLWDRLYFPLAIRQDAGSGLGNKVAPKFPKLSFSYLVSDEPYFRSLPLANKLNTLRIRLAYGQAGVQPPITSKLRTYSQRNVSLDGPVIPTLAIASVGNADLKPERSTELEGGFDVDVLDNRVSLAMTFYRKKTIDMLISQSMPPSVGLVGATATTFAAPMWQRNVGNVDNNGMEVTIGTTWLRREAASWTTNVNISRNRNELTKMAPSLVTGGQALLGIGVSGTGYAFNRFVKGYPLYGTWTLPVIGYADLDNNGLITAGEVQLGDSSAYMGAPYPNYEASIHNTLTIFKRINVGVTFNYQNGLTQVNSALAGTTGLAFTRAFNDPTTPLSTQAYLGAAIQQGFSKMGSAIGYIQTVSTLRLNSLSVGYTVPPTWLRSVLGSRSVRFSVQGTNLGLWTNYRGKDPNVNQSLTETLQDSGILPTPRVWQFSLGIN